MLCTSNHVWLTFKLSESIAVQQNNCRELIRGQKRFEAVFFFLPQVYRDLPLACFLYEGLFNLLVFLMTNCASKKHCNNKTLPAFF